jgi:hypothetical protein
MTAVSVTLQPQPPRRDVQLGEQIGDGGDEGRKRERLWTDVDGHGQDVPAVLEALEGLERRAEHALGERAEQAVQRGGVQERGGGKEAALRVLLAHERLDAEHDLADQVDLRLVVRDELVASEGVAQVACGHGAGAGSSVDDSGTRPLSAESREA